MCDIGGRLLIERVYDRVVKASRVAEVIVATSVDPTDDPLVDFCFRRSIGCFRGSLNDVAGRLIAASQLHGAESFVRISGDSPLLDPTIVDLAVDLFERERPDLATNVFPRTFPVGQSVEVVSRMSLEELWNTNLEPDHQEHVTSGFYANPDSWHIASFENNSNRSFPSLAVDTHEDRLRILQILQRVDDVAAGWEELVRVAECL